jgi:hypothetical protein
MLIISIDEKLLWILFIMTKKHKHCWRPRIGSVELRFRRLYQPHCTSTSWCFFLKSIHLSMTYPWKKTQTVMLLAHKTPEVSAHNRVKKNVIGKTGCMICCSIPPYAMLGCPQRKSIIWKHSMAASIMFIPDGPVYHQFRSDRSLLLCVWTHLIWTFTIMAHPHRSDLSPSPRLLPSSSSAPPGLVAGMSITRL